MWIRKKSTKYNKYYYFNTETNSSIWHKPITDYHIYHILIKHENSRKPVKLPEDKALQECKELLDKIQNDVNPVECFKELATMRSDCSSNKNYGDLGFIVSGEMYMEFEKAAFKLQKGSFDGPVKTMSGYHIIYRE